MTIHQHIADSVCHQTLLKLVQRLAEFPAESPALEEDGRVMSYGELDQLSDDVAKSLLASGVQPGDAVALMMKRGALACAGLLGILKAGAAYVPIDPALPQERQRWMLQDSGATAVVGHTEWTSLPCIHPAQLPAMAEVSLPRHSEADAAAWIIYTSGTTGNPKGVVVSQKAAWHFIEAEAAAFGVQNTDRVWHGLSLSFDASVEEMWLAWRSGACLVIGSHAETRDAETTALALSQRGVTVFSSVPSFLAMMPDELPTVTLLITGGEACTPALLEKFCRPGRRFLNTYGPTEATVVATWQELAPGAPITIGKTFPHLRSLIVDPETLALAAMGELWLGGPALANGYRNLPEITAEKFCTHPQFGDRWYRTGDRVSRDSAGNYLFHGRLDGQVKLRGFRIELEEVEAALRAATGLSAVAAAVKSSGGRDILVAYTVGSIHEPDLIHQLRSTLPVHMVPQCFVAIKSLPLRVSGKVDRAVLPAPQASGSEETPLLHKLWGELFPGRSIAGDTNFFTELGGDSLSAALLVSRLRKEPGWQAISISSLYSHPTLDELGNFLANQQAAAPQLQQNVVSARAHAACGLAQATVLPFLLFLRALPWLLTTAGLVAWEKGSNYSWWFILGLLWLGIPQVGLAAAVVCKRLVAWHLPVGDHPLWGVVYFRFWLSRQLIGLFAPRYAAGSPLAVQMLRWCGAKIGPGTRIDTLDFGLAEHIELGAGVSIEAGAHIHPWTVEDGLLKIRKIRIGDHARIGAKSFVPGGSEIPARACLLANQNASNQAAITLDAEPPHAGYEAGSTLALTHRYFWLMLATSLPILISALVATSMWSGKLAQLPWIVCLAVGLWIPLTTATGIALMRFFGRNLPATFAPYSPEAAQHWQLQATWTWISGQVFPLLASVFTAPLLRACGAKIGKQSELSSLEHFVPNRLNLAEGTFVADSVSLGAIQASAGTLMLGSVGLGARTFIGNNSLVPGNIHLGESNLLGVLSLADTSMETATQASWIGSPAMALPNRQSANAFPETSTYKPAMASILARGAWEMGRLVLAQSVWWSIGLAAIVTSMELALLPRMGLLWAASCGLAIAMVSLTILLKWLLIGKFRPGQHPLWSSFVWRAECVAVLHEYAAVPTLVTHLQGTPLISLYFRALGAKFGHRIYCDTIFLTEFDLIHLGDDAQLNTNADPQTHLFEDRVMKCGNVHLAAGASLGSMSVVLYDAHVGEKCSIAPLSLVMKGEGLPAGTRWAGSPVASAA